MLITWRYVMLEPEVLASPADRAAMASLAAAAAAAGLVPAIVAGWCCAVGMISDAILVTTRQL